MQDEVLSDFGTAQGSSAQESVAQASGIYKRVPRFKGSWKIKNLSPWSYPDAAAAGAAADAASAAASAVCILSGTYGREAPPIIT